MLRQPAAANWPNTIQCLGSDDIMSLGIKSFATGGVGTKNFSRILVPGFLTCPELRHILEDNMFQEFGAIVSSFCQVINYFGTFLNHTFFKDLVQFQFNCVAGCRATS